MTPGLIEIIDKVHCSGNFNSPEMDFHIAVNACCIDYTDTGSLNWIHWLSNSQSTNCSIIHYGCERMVHFDTGVAHVSLRIIRIQPLVSEEFSIPWLPATVPNRGSMDHCYGHHGSFKAIPILDPVDVQKAYNHSASHYHCTQWHVQLDEWQYASCNWEEDFVEGTLKIGHVVCCTEAVQILCWRDCNDGYVSHFCTQASFIMDIVIFYKVGQRNWSQSWGRAFLHNQLPGGISEVCGEWILRQTWMFAHH